MSSQNSQSKQQRSPRLAPDDDVVTPSGSVATVMAVYPDVGEALVQWTTGERARFKFGVLRLVPRKGDE